MDHTTSKNEVQKFKQQELLRIAKTFDPRSDITQEVSISIMWSDLFSGSMNINVPGKYYGKEIAKAREQLTLDYRQGSAADKKLAEAILASEYAIYFKPPVAERLYILELLLQYFRLDTDCLSLITCITIDIRIVLHCALGKDNAAKLLNKLRHFVQQVDKAKFSNVYKTHYKKYRVDGIIYYTCSSQNVLGDQYTATQLPLEAAPPYVTNTAALYAWQSTAVPKEEALVPPEIIAKLHAIHSENSSIVKISRKHAAALGLPELRHSVIFVDNYIYALYDGKDNLLGAGVQGRVKYAQDIATNKWWAVKISKEVHEDYMPWKSEIRFIAKYSELRGAVRRHTEGKGYIFQTAYLGQEPFYNLFDSFNEQDSARKILLKYIVIAKSLALSMRKIQADRVVHRDIRLPNFIQLHNGECVLLDFGRALQVPKGQSSTQVDDLRHNVICAPEVKDWNKYSTASDAFALGILLQNILAEIRPIYKAMQLQDQILLDYLAEINKNVIMALQRHNPLERPDLERCLLNLSQYELLITNLPCGNQQLLDSKQLFLAIVHGDLIVATELITKNPQLLQCANSDAQTPLHIAVLSGRVPLIYFLTQCKADLSKKTNDGNTPYELATSIFEQDDPIMQCLREPVMDPKPVAAKSAPRHSPILR